MKYRSFFSLGLVWLLSGTAALALNPDSPKQLEIRVQFIEMTAENANTLLLADDLPTDTRGWSERLKTLLSSGQGTVAASATVITKSGQRASVESVDEHIYPTEFDTPNEDKDSKNPSSSTGVPIPTTFEMRPVGVRLEVDPVLGADGETVDLNLAPEWIQYFGDKSQVQVPVAGSSVEAELQPRFYSIKTQTSVTLTNGGSALIGEHLPPDEEGVADSSRRILMFVSVRVIEA
ncbi:MAG: hypothetical protein KDK99_18525 [Verrucomicrobiales bacterium]|nr:hypothetical protein [Verrucomicrobiales bacterium]